MSAELIEIDDDENGFTVFLTMTSNCHAWLSVLSDGDYYSRFHLEPNEEGKAKAKAIIDGLQSWINQVEATS